MKVWLLIKVIVAACVLTILGFTAALGYHVFITPLGGIFSRVIPNPGEIVQGPPDEKFAELLNSEDLPDIEPGERAFRKAHELIALGELAEARERLLAVVSVFPTSNAAPTARHIVSEMNLDDLLSTANQENKEIHIVKRGDSYFGIAATNDTSLEMIVHLNGLLDLKGLQPGDELIVMPLQFRLLIEPRRKAISLWDGGKFIAEFPIRAIHGSPGANRVTRVDAIVAYREGKRVTPASEHFRAAEKTISIAGLGLPIRALPEDPEDLEDLPRAIMLDPPDLEELALLLRAENEVEIRN